MTIIQCKSCKEAWSLEKSWKSSLENYEWSGWKKEEILGREISGGGYRVGGGGGWGGGGGKKKKKKF